MSCVLCLVTLVCFLWIDFYILVFYFPFNILFPPLNSSVILSRTILYVLVWWLLQLSECEFCTSQKGLGYTDLKNSSSWLNGLAWQRFISHSHYIARCSVGNCEGPRKMENLPSCSCAIWNTWPPGLPQKGKKVRCLRLGSPETDSKQRFVCTAFVRVSSQDQHL